MRLALSRQILYGLAMETHLTTAEAAQLTGCSVYTLCQLRSRGGGPPYLKIDGHWVRYLESDLRAWMKSKEERIVERIEPGAE